MNDPDRLPLADAVLSDVLSERLRQHEKFGDQSHMGRLFMLAVLTEEVGEVAQAIIEDDINRRRHETPYDDPDLHPLVPRDAWQKAIRAELVQVAAVAVQMIEHIDAEAKQ